MRTLFGRPRFRHLEKRGHRAHRTEQRQHNKDDTPAAEQQQLPADQRREQRPDRRNDGEHRQHARGIGWPVRIAGDCAREHRGRACAECLHEAERHQRFDGKRQRAGHTRQRIHDDAAEQDGPAAIGIRQRTIEQHADRKTEHKAGERGLRGAGADDERLRDRRQARQIHIDGNRPACGERTEQQNQPAIGPASGDVRHGNPDEAPRHHRQRNAVKRGKQQLDDPNCTRRLDHPPRFAPGWTARPCAATSAPPIG